MGPGLPAGLCRSAGRRPNTQSAVPYLQSLRLDKDELVQALGLSFTLSTLALAAGLELVWRSVR